MHRTIVRLSLTLILLALSGQPLVADTAAEAAERIKERLAQIDDLKESGAVGEDARGYLSPRGAIGAREQSLVNAENADRRIMYAEVARRTNQTLDDVGTQRAIQIASRARSGVWLQKPDGEWFRKP